jgi:hypothetical protein
VIVFVIVLVAVWLLVAVPWAVRDGRRPHVPAPARHRPGEPGESVVRHDVEVHHVHTMQHEHTVRHVHEVRAAAERAPVAPLVVEGTVVRELPR